MKWMPRSYKKSLFRCGCAGRHHFTRRAWFPHQCEICRLRFWWEPYWWDIIGYGGVAWNEYWCESCHHRLILQSPR